MFHNSRFKLVVIVLTVLLFVGQSCATSGGVSRASTKPFTLKWWRYSTEDQGALDQILAEFKKTYPHIAIDLQYIRPEEYESALINAWVEGKGPDIYSIPVGEIKKWKTKILPMPASMKSAKKVVVSKLFGLKQEEQIKYENIPGFKLKDIRSKFIDTVSRDVYQDGKILGLPLGVDMLVMYYNKDILNQAKIAKPPETWQEFIDSFKQLVAVDSNGDFLQMAAGIGAGSNIRYAPDLYALLAMQLMSQRDMEILDSRGQVALTAPVADQRDYFPGVEALKFYSSFASPVKETYTWNARQTMDYEAFKQKRLAFFFGSSKLINDLRGATQLNFDIAKVPQLSPEEGSRGAVKAAQLLEYPIETVFSKSAHPDEAWILVMLATHAKNVKSYLDKSLRISAQKELLAGQAENIDLANFVNDALYGKTWYRGKNYEKARNALRSLLDKAATNDFTEDKQWRELLRRTEAEIGATL